MTKYFSACSGIGGFELGINYVLPDATCVGYSEINPHAAECYQHHFTDHKNYGDITKIDTAELPDFDLFVGGFPCQAFSVAGRGEGFDDIRGTVFFEFVRILYDKRPRHFLFENVKGLVSNKGGETYASILEVLTLLGYRVEVQLLNSKNFGLPQSRDRMFFIGHLGDECEREILSFPGDTQTFPAVQGCVTNTLTARYPGAQGTGSYVVEGKQHAQENKLKQVGCLYENGHMGGRVYDPSGLARTTIAKGGGLGAKTGLYLIDGCDIRRLTPTEGERLQGFPDGWTAMLPEGKRYECIGNAVSVNVIAVIIFFMRGCLDTI